MSKDIIKSFGTVLKDNFHVKLQSTKYKAIKKPITKTLPKSFNPIDVWGDYLSKIRDQGKCGACWAMASTGALADRYTIMTLGQFAVNLSAYQMIMCQGTILPDIPLDETSLSQVNLQAHTEGACNGNSLYNAMNFMYSIGLVTDICVNKGEFQKYGIIPVQDIENPESIQMCQSILGTDYDTCLDRKKAARYYRIIAGYEVDKDIESIKEEIYKWGPVVAGFQVYDNFLNDYDGISIYTGPKKDSMVQGGHAVRIMGWGTENGVDFWWIANSWGTNWGRSGYFKMKMGIKECGLEDNVVGFIPDLPSFKNTMLNYTLSINPETIALRSWINIDPITGYKYSTITKIRNGQLIGDLNPIVNKDLLPNFDSTWFGEITPEDAFAFTISDKQYEAQINSKITTLTILVILVISFFIGKIIKRFFSYKKKK